MSTTLLNVVVFGWHWFLVKLFWTQFSGVLQIYSEIFLCSPSLSKAVFIWLISWAFIITSRVMWVRGSVLFFVWYKSRFGCQSSRKFNTRVQWRIQGVADPRDGGSRDAIPALFGPNSFIFKQFLAKGLYNNYYRMAHPPGKFWIHRWFVKFVNIL